MVPQRTSFQGLRRGARRRKLYGVSPRGRRQLYSSLIFLFLRLQPRVHGVSCGFDRHRHCASVFRTEALNLSASVFYSPSFTNYPLLLLYLCSRLPINSDSCTRVSIFIRLQLYTAVADLNNTALFLAVLQTVKTLENRRADGGLYYQRLNLCRKFGGERKTTFRVI